MCADVLYSVHTHTEQSMCTECSCRAPIQGTTSCNFPCTTRRTVTQLQPKITGFQLNLPRFEFDSIQLINFILFCGPTQPLAPLPLSQS